MSAVSMANIAIVKQRGIALDELPGGQRPSMAAEGSVDGVVTPDNAATASLKLVTSYIPTEILTLYVAGIAIFLTSDSSAKPNYGAAWLTFWIYFFLTPVFNLLVFALKRQASALPFPKSPNKWPWFETVAATVSFTVWAAALPTTPFVTLPWYSQSLAGYVVLVVTTLLGLLSQLTFPKGG
jgi:hypothetical protein